MTEGSFRREDKEKGKQTLQAGSPQQGEFLLSSAASNCVIRSKCSLNQSSGNIKQNQPK